MKKCGCLAFKHWYSKQTVDMKDFNCFDFCPFCSHLLYSEEEIQRESRFHELVLKEAIETITPKELDELEKLEEERNRLP